MLRRSVTQMDIAREVGVSRSAVKAVFCPDPRTRLSPQARQRILATANRLGYRPNRHAQLMRGKKSGLIGMLHFGGFSEVNELRSLRAATAVGEHGYHPLIHHVLWYQENVQDAFNALLDARVEGLLLVSPSERIPATFLDQIRNSGLPVVSLSGVRHPGVPQVRSDFHQGMFELATHLLGLGHRKLVLLAKWGTEMRDENHAWGVFERVAGFQEAVQQFRPFRGESEVICESEGPLTAEYQAGRSAMQKLLQRANRPEAVLCMNDSWAVGALTACAKAGVRVPEDMALTGCDNDAIGEFSIPPLTTIAQQTAAIAEKAVEMLVRLIRGEKLSDGEELVKIPCHLVVRESCGTR